MYLLVRKGCLQPFSVHLCALPWSLKDEMLLLAALSLYQEFIGNCDGPGKCLRPNLYMGVCLEMDNLIYPRGFTLLGVSWLVKERGTRAFSLLW